MTDNERARASILATINDIRRIQLEMGFTVTEPADREAYDIVCRIERRIKSRVATKAGEAA